MIKCLLFSLYLLLESYNTSMGGFHMHTCITLEECISSCTERGTYPLTFQGTDVQWQQLVQVHQDLQYNHNLESMWMAGHPLLTSSGVLHNRNYGELDGVKGININSISF